MTEVTKIFHITLAVAIRPLTDDEISRSGSDALDEDCQPTGGQEDLDEVSAHDMAEMAAYAVENAEDMWGGSNLYAAVSDVSIVGAVEA